MRAKSAVRIVTQWATPAISLLSMTSYLFGEINDGNFQLFIFIFIWCLFSYQYRIQHNYNHKWNLINDVHTSDKKLRKCSEAFFKLSEFFGRSGLVYSWTVRPLTTILVSGVFEGGTLRGVPKVFQGDPDGFGGFPFKGNQNIAENLRDRKSSHKCLLSFWSSQR